MGYQILVDGFTKNCIYVGYFRYRLNAVEMLVLFFSSFPWDIIVETYIYFSLSIVDHIYKTNYPLKPLQRKVQRNHCHWN